MEWDWWLSPFVAVSEKGRGDVTFPELNLERSHSVLSWPCSLSDELVGPSLAVDVMYTCVDSVLFGDHVGECNDLEMESNQVDIFLLCCRVLPERWGGHDTFVVRSAKLYLEDVRDCDGECVLVEVLADGGKPCWSDVWKVYGRVLE